MTAAGSYIPQIDGLRFLALAPVLFYHAGLRGERSYPGLTPAEDVFSTWLPHGGAGVSLFFFISGYIIAYPFMSGARPGLKQFYMRRLLRLEPPYILVMVGCFLVLSAGFRPADAPGFNATDVPLWQSLAASLVYLHSFIFGSHPRLNPPTWSLEREVQFYLIAPFLFGLYVLCRQRTPRLLFGALAVVSTILIGGAVQYWSDETDIIRHSLLAEAYGFLLGVVICDWSIATRPADLPKRRFYDVLFWIGLALLLISGSIQHHFRDAFFYIPNAVLRVAAILSLYMGAMRGGFASRLMANSWITLIGGACYSIYLIHVPLMQGLITVIRKVVVFESLAQAWALSFALLIPAALIAGLMFYILVERPFMQREWPQRVISFLRGRLSRRNGSH
ncbi:acyltransferase family protein [Caulobacter sp. NIBR2454]|uniref:acyltransferase family protein n=1 Tax=Caulobacter sp. NIBR2454 TaxID=3015996 RepID=UPI0022B64C3F|nr:acyltransferase [Caulobacter sp. NIBR2454]